MSSTSNIQNLLVNVFRPTVSYDGSLGYVPKVNLCNIDTISAKSLAVTTFGLGDSNGNIFIGSNSGGTSSNTNNTVIGVTAGSGMANSTSCVYIGNIAGIGAQGASNVISIGKETRGAGNSNIYIGSLTGSSNSSSSNNILIGHGLNFSNQVISNTLQIGRPGSLVIQGDLANKRVGINTAPSYGLDVCGSFSFHDSNGNFTYALDGSGNTQIDFRSSNAGKKAVMNIVGDVYGQNFFGSFQGSINTPGVTMGNGSILAPSYTFSNDLSTGFYYSGTPATLGITTRSCNSMAITTTGVGIGKSNPSTALDVSGVLTAPAIINGSYIRNALNPTLWDISGGNIAIQSNLTAQTITATGDISSSGTIYGNFVSTGVTTNNIIVPGFIRNASTGFNLDISSGNISNAGTLRTGNSTVVISNGSIVDTSTNPIFRLATGISTFQVDMSGGNISNSGTTSSSNFITLSASSNGIGGVTLSNSNITYAGAIFNNLSNTSNYIGGVTLSNSNARVGVGTINIPSLTFGSDASLGLYSPGTNQIGFTSAGIQRMVISNSNIGIGVSNPSFAIDISGGIRSVLNVSNTIGGVTLSNYDIVAGNPASSTITSVVEMGGGYNDTGSANTRSAPALSFQYGDITTGGFRHFARSRHNAGVGNSGNAIDFYTNDSVSSSASSGPGTGNKLGLSITSAGIGIGTLTPSYNLDVSGTIRGTNNLLFSTNGSAGTPLIATTGFSNTGFYFASDAQPAVCQGSQEITRWNGGGMFTSISGTTTTPSIGWYPEATGFSKPAVGKISIITSGTEKMTISGTNVGIGTTAPSNLLDVTTGARTGTHSSNLALYATRAAASNSDPIVSFSHTNGAAGVGIGWNSVLSIGTNATNDLFLYSKGAGNIVFSDLSGFVERGRFSSNGNMGIGCNAPAYKLDVNNALTAPAINMSSYPRFGFSNVTIVNGLSSTTLVGKAVNFSNATITMDANLSSWISSNATNGNSFRPLVSGIWSINVNGWVTTNGDFAWIDGSTNDVAATAHATIGNQYLAFAQPNGTALSLNYTGYLNASNYYKIKTQTASQAGYWSAVFTFLGATSTTTDYPYRKT